VAQFTIFVAILNLGLGFTAAVYLGRRYRSLQAFSSHRVALAASPTGPALRAVATPEIAVSAAPTASAVPSTPSIAADATSPPGNASNSAVSVAAAEVETAVPAAVNTASLQRIQAEAEQYREHLLTIDGQLRHCAEVPERDTVEACLRELMITTEEYVKKRDQNQKTLERSGEASEKKASYDALNETFKLETRQIEQTTAVVEAFDYQSDLSQGCRQIVDQTGCLLEANLCMRDTLAQTIDSEIQDQAAPSDAPLHVDEPVSALAHVAMGNLLAQWCASDSPQTRHLSAALVDLDQFALINRQFGHGVGDRLLKAVADLLSAECCDAGQIGRLQGETFLVLLPDAEARSATNLVDRIRQTIELARFQYQGTEIRLTLSGAITELRPGDTPESFLARLKNTLALAKRYGRNRCFLHEGEYPAPVIPPTFRLTAKEIVL
jgi:diguanylate cyclase (GGDEF)-like protein